MAQILFAPSLHSMHIKKKRVSLSETLRNPQWLGVGFTIHIKKIENRVSRHHGNDTLSLPASETELAQPAHTYPVDSPTSVPVARW